MILFLIALAAAADPLVAKVETQPVTVRKFVERRASCNHFAGEEGYDRERQRFLDRTVKELRCGDLERDEQVLRQRYAGSPDIIAILDQSEDMLAF
jgi:hypothetical protein